MCTDLSANTPESKEERTLRTVELEIGIIQRQTAQIVLSSAIEIGRRLNEAKAMLPHGSWGEWLKKMDFSQSSANNFMRIFREYGADQQSLFGGEAKSQALANLTYTKALRLLALPSEEEREQFAAEHDIESMSTRELEQALAEASAAEQARARMEADMKLTKELLDRAQADAAKADEHAARLKQELEELKNRPVEVAVAEADPDALARARAEGEAAKAAELAAIQEKLELEKKKAKKLRADLDTAAQGRAHAESALGEAQAKLAAQAEKPSVLNSDAELAQFKLLFGQAQRLVNQMRGLLLKVRSREDQDQAGKLANALTALADQVRGCAQ